MQTVGTILRSHRRRLGLTLQQVADLVGCTKGYLSSIENDRRDGPPSTELLSRIESALRLDAGCLVNVGKWQETPEVVRRRVLDLETDRHMARRLARLLAREGVDRLHRSGELQSLVERLERDSGAAPPAGSTSASRPSHFEGSEGAKGVKSSSTPAWRSVLPLQVPLINKVSAGYPTEFTDLGYPARVADEYVSVPDISDPDAFAARVVGDSMEPQYREGDIVVFSPLAATPAGGGCDCFVRFERDGESTFKRVFFEPGPDSKGEAKRGMIRLQPLNQRYAPRMVSREEVAGLYAAVFVVRAVRPA